MLKRFYAILGVAVLAVSLYSCALQESSEDAGSTAPVTSGASPALGSKDAVINILSAANVGWAVEDRNLDPNDFPNIDGIKFVIRFNKDGSGDVTYWTLYVGATKYVEDKDGQGNSRKLPFQWSLDSTGDELVITTQGDPNAPPEIDKYTSVAFANNNTELSFIDDDGIRQAYNKEMIQ